MTDLNLIWLNLLSINSWVIILGPICVNLDSDLELVINSDLLSRVRKSPDNRNQRTVHDHSRKTTVFGVQILPVCYSHWNYGN